METIPIELVRNAVRAALEEDVGTGDVTTLSTVPREARCEAVMAAREPLVFAGADFAEEAFRILDPEVEIERVTAEGARAEKGAVLLRLRGRAQALLTAERVALNFTQRLSGVATLTAEFVAAVAGTRVKILDTRKTRPGWRLFEKYAVRAGGGTNHRTGLYDMVLIKDNHLAALRGAMPNPIAAAVRRAREQYPGLRVEVEADRLDQVSQAVDAGADIILLDNMSLDQMREAVGRCAGRAQTEASGGVSLDRVRAIAQTGVDFISVGALTHSARSVDIGLDFSDPVV